jgi:hypothetical protein
VDTSATAASFADASDMGGFYGFLPRSNWSSDSSTSLLADGSTLKDGVPLCERKTVTIGGTGKTLRFNWEGSLDSDHSAVFSVDGVTKITRQNETFGVTAENYALAANQTYELKWCLEGTPGATHVLNSFFLRDVDFQ